MSFAEFPNFGNAPRALPFPCLCERTSSSVPRTQDRRHMDERSPRGITRVAGREDTRLHL